MERAVEALKKLADHNTFLNVFLLGCFGTLSYRSFQQQNQILAMEAENDAISKTNKSIKKTIWDWKHQLFSEAESAGPDALLPISTLRAIYGDASPSASPLVSGGKVQKEVDKSQAPKLII